MSRHDQRPALTFPGFLTHFASLPWAVRLVWDAAPAWSAGWLALLVTQGLLPIAMVHLVRLLVNSVVATRSARSSWESLLPTLILVAGLAGVLLVTEVLKSLTEWVRTAQAELVQDHISHLLHAKSVAVDLAFYESADYYDRLHRARTEAAGRPLVLLESIGGTLQSGITLMGMAAVLVPYGGWLPLALVGSTLPALPVIFRFNRRFHGWWERTTADRRWVQYYDLMLTHGAAAAEVRMFELGSYLASAYQTLRRRLRQERIDLLKRQGIARLAASLLGLSVTGVTAAWMISRVLQGAATLGDLALFYQAFSQGQNLLRSLLSSAGQVYSNSLFLGNLHEFLSLEPRIVDPDQPLPTPVVPQVGLCFRQVTFRYPGSQRPALRDFNLTIPAGQTVAIVGANGAGKSTLVKLLCRFYDPDEGRVEIDGIDLRDLSVAELRRRITVLFQFPQYYYATAAENIAIADLAANPSRTEIEAAARRAGAHEMITRLPRGYDTLLGKGFTDGTDLSGGEWQRLALARSFLRDAPIVILDEPTSFMDSWAEIEWLDRFRNLVQGRTVLIITHRFTTAMRADIVHVMQRGQIVESGSHDELISRGGLYAQSWMAQQLPTDECRDGILPGVS